MNPNKKVENSNPAKRPKDVPVNPKKDMPSDPLQTNFQPEADHRTDPSSFNEEKNR